jgi:hypothetical protein
MPKSELIETPATALADGRAQLNVKIDAALKAQFVAQCDKRSQSQAQVIEQLIDAYVSAANEAEVRHLDGQLCPINSMIRSLSDAVQSQIATSGFALKLK